MCYNIASVLSFGFLPRGLWVSAPRLGTEPVPPALEGEVLTTGPPGKSQHSHDFKRSIPHLHPHPHALADYAEVVHGCFICSHSKFHWPKLFHFSYILHCAHKWQAMKWISSSCSLVINLREFTKECCGVGYYIYDWQPSPNNLRHFPQLKAPFKGPQCNFLDDNDKRTKLYRRLQAFH